MKRVLLMIIALMLACAAGCGTKPSRPELPTNIADIPVASAAPTVDETLIEPSAEPSAEAPDESPVEASEPTAYYILGDGVRATALRPREAKMRNKTK